MKQINARDLFDLLIEFVAGFCFANITFMALLLLMCIHKIYNMYYRNSYGLFYFYYNDCTAHLELVFYGIILRVKMPFLEYYFNFLVIYKL